MFVSIKKIYFLSSVLWHFHVSTKIWTIASFFYGYCRYVFYLRCETLYGLADHCMQHLQILRRRLYTENKGLQLPSFGGDRDLFQKEMSPDTCNIFLKRSGGISVCLTVIIKLRMCVWYLNDTYTSFTREVRTCQNCLYNAYITYYCNNHE